MPPWLILPLQAVFALLAMRWWHRAVLANCVQMRQPELILDVWGPIAMVLPMLFAVRWIGSTVEGAGWTAAGAPVACGVAALALALLIGDRRVHADRYDDDLHYPLQLVAASIVAGLAFLLLGAAHTMTVWIGQCAFALGAIVLWINTPDLDRAEAGAATAAESNAVLGMVIVLVCSGGQGLAAWGVEPEFRWVSATIMVAHALGALGLAAWSVGQVACVRLGVWAATIGVLFTFGLIALSRLIARLPLTFVPDAPPPPVVVARGFGAYALEAALLLILAVAAMAALRLPRGGQLVAGVIVSLGVLTLILARLASV